MHTRLWRTTIFKKKARKRDKRNNDIKNIKIWKCFFLVFFNFCVFLLTLYADAVVYLYLQYHLQNWNYKLYLSILILQQFGLESSNTFFKVSCPTVLILSYIFTELIIELANRVVFSRLDLKPVMYLQFCSLVHQAMHLSLTLSQLSPQLLVRAA